MTSRRCSGTTPAGAGCKAKPVDGSNWCHWHDPSPEARERHRQISSRGGNQKAYGQIPTIAALADDARVASLDLTTAAGLRDYLGAALGALGRLPFDTRVANAISAIANTQRAVIETSDLEARIVALEQRDVA